MNNIYTVKSKVNASQVGFSARMRFDSILTTMQDLALTHSIDLGIDRDTILKNYNAIWVVCKFKVKIHKLPKINEELIFSTWPLQAGLAKFTREFSFNDGDEEFISGTSEWAVLNAETFKVMESKAINYPFKMEHQESLGVAGSFTHYTEKFTPDDFAKSFIVETSDIDANKHTNNVTYAKMIINLYSPEEYEKENFKELEIHYLNQSYYGDKIDIYRKVYDKGIFFEGLVGDKKIFAGSLLK